MIYQIESILIDLVFKLERRKIVSPRLREAYLKKAEQSLLTLIKGLRPKSIEGNYSESFFKGYKHCQEELDKNIENLDK
jgi:hypothetical protein